MKKKEKAKTKKLKNNKFKIISIPLNDNKILQKISQFKLKNPNILIKQIGYANNCLLFEIPIDLKEFSNYMIKY